MLKEYYLKFKENNKDLDFFIFVFCVLVAIIIMQHYLLLVYWDYIEVLHVDQELMGKFILEHKETMGNPVLDI